MTRSTLLCVGVAAATVLVLGCAGAGGGPELGQVTGTVIIDGAPAANVDVSFMPTGGGRPSSGKTDSNGKYELIFSATETGAQVGSHEVSIAQAVDLGLDSGTEVSSEPLESESSIPKEYLETKKTVEVKSGSNTIDLTYP